MVVSGWGVFDGAWGWARPTFGGLAPGRVWPIVGFHPFFFFLFILLGLTFGIVILRASMPIGYFVIFSFMDA